jgi:beta-galactosidase/beta-glucuronidase
LSLQGLGVIFVSTSQEASDKTLENPMSSLFTDEEDLQYPRPMLRRRAWFSLDGDWDFVLDPDMQFRAPREIHWESAVTIRVPFSPETPKSGIGNTGFYRSCWYRRGFRVPPLVPGQQLLLHLGAVDYVATVYIDGLCAGRHEGGYTPFTLNITELIRSGSEHIIIVHAEDDPLDLTKPRGKQDWQLEPHSIWYPRTTGIWQPIWLETVSSAWIGSLRFTATVSAWEIGFEAWLKGERLSGLRLSLKLRAGDQMLADDSYEVVCGEVHRRIALSDPGIDDYRNELLWSPESPTLIQAEIQLKDGRGQLLDEIFSYTALRTVSVHGDRFMLNGRPYFMRLVLDQGYWPESGLSAPDPAALRRDVELAKAMGFNGVRKHQKVEDPRFLYWADRLGLLVWEEMPSAYRFTQQSIERVTQEWTAVIRRDFSHPCIVAWVPFNESWGVPNLPLSPTEQHYVRALYHLTKTLDSTRPIIGNDGWESVATDIIGIHDYDTNPDKIACRYHSDEVIPRLLKHGRPGGRSIIIGERVPADHPPLVLSEFGGIAVAQDAKDTWGYSQVDSSAELQVRYRTLLSCVGSLSALTGYCYTQFTDTYQEANGLLYADRTPKFPLAEIAAANRGVSR